ncbi:MAG: NgoFVII family restriction endonuclease [Clostridiales bacterium]|nr:NgoFVII family restriction endonuclease [Clostridiales bacterium]
MEFLFSNYPPVKTEFSTFYEKFYSLIPTSSRLDIAVGYVSSDSLMELKRIIELNQNIQELNLIVGMHYFEYFTKVQYKAALDLNGFLTSNHIGEVKLVNAFKYHGKLYSYSRDAAPYAGIIGSNNLSGILDTGSRLYESALFIEEVETVCKMNKFIELLSRNASKNIAELDIDTFNPVTSVLEGHEGVDRLLPGDQSEIEERLSEIKFDIPAKTEPKSNLNCYHGKGRENMSTHLVKPRHWYEVELIVPINMRRMPDYPKGTPKGEPETEFRVYTDDGFSFMCQVNGGEEGLWNKNLRSSRDLTVLGKWIKGRLENEGVLNVGDVITAETLRAYGRNTITMTKLKDSNDWYLDFGVR